MNALLAETILKNILMATKLRRIGFGILNLSIPICATSIASLQITQGIDSFLLIRSQFALLSIILLCSIVLIFISCVSHYYLTLNGGMWQVLVVGEKLNDKLNKGGISLGFFLMSLLGLALAILLFMPNVKGGVFTMLLVASSVIAFSLTHRFAAKRCNEACIWLNNYFAKNSDEAQAASGECVQAEVHLSHSSQSLRDVLNDQGVLIAVAIINCVSLITCAALLGGSVNSWLSDYSFGEVARFGPMIVLVYAAILIVLVSRCLSKVGCAWREFDAKFQRLKLDQSFIISVSVVRFRIIVPVFINFFLMLALGFVLLISIGKYSDLGYLVFVFAIAVPCALYRKLKTLNLDKVKLECLGTHRNNGS